MNIKNILFLLSLAIINPIHAMEKDLSKNTHKSLFERGIGFWSNPADEVKEDFFSKLTDPKSQRENWYKVSPYIAEFLCATSNAGFIYVGLQHNSPELLLAGTASIISHSIPKQWLLMVDKIGVIVVATKVLREYQTLIDNPWLLVPVALAGAINASDAYLARTQGTTWPHVIWHLSAAAIADIFLRYTK